MSSNLSIPKACIYCNQEFIAKKITTRYCSHNCNRRHYKQVGQIKRIAKEIRIIAPIKDRLVPCGQEVSIPEAARILGVSDRTVFRLIERRLIKVTRKGQRVRIKTADLLKVKVYDNLD